MVRKDFIDATSATEPRALRRGRVVRGCPSPSRSDSQKVAGTYAWDIHSRSRTATRQPPFTYSVSTGDDRLFPSRAICSLHPICLSCDINYVDHDFAALSLHTIYKSQVVHILFDNKLYFNGSIQYTFHPFVWFSIPRQSLKNNYSACFSRPPY